MARSLPADLLEPATARRHAMSHSIQPLSDVPSPSLREIRRLARSTCHGHFAAAHPARLTWSSGLTSPVDLPTQSSPCPHLCDQAAPRTPVARDTPFASPISQHPTQQHVPYRPHRPPEPRLCPVRIHSDLPPCPGHTLLFFDRPSLIVPPDHTDTCQPRATIPGHPVIRPRLRRLAVPFADLACSTTPRQPTLTNPYRPKNRHGTAHPCSTFLVIP